MDCILHLSANGQHFRNWYEAMVASQVKPSMAGDIWSHGGCSLIVINIAIGICISITISICFCCISRPAWKIDEWLVAATPFGSTRHTSEAIDSITVAAFRKQGVKWREGGSVYEAVHSKVSDNASNMVAKGWTGFDGGFCVDHIPSSCRSRSSPVRKASRRHLHATRASSATSTAPPPASRTSLP